MAASVFDPSNQDDINRKIAVGIERITQVLKTLVWNESKVSGLSPIQIQFLTALAYESKDEWTITDFATRFHLTPATVSDALTALEKKQLVERTQGSEDRRTVFVSLTPEGKRHARKLSGWLNALEDHVNGLAEDDKPVLLKSLMLLIAAFQERGLIAINRMCTSCAYFRPNVHADGRLPHHCAYIDKPLGNAELRIDCPEFEAASVGE
jgi:DNA-binding MarR family transcriptional regulator